MRYFVLLVTALLLTWRVGAASPELMDGVAAIVNRKVITYSEVVKYAQPAIQQLRRDYSGDALREKVRAAQMDALNNLIDRALIVDEYSQKGYKLPDNIVDTQIDEVIATDFGGDRTAFIKTLEAEGLTISSYRDKMRERIIVQAMRNRRMQQEAVISPAEIEKYYQEHLADFKEEDQIKLRMIYLKHGPAAPAPAPVAGEAAADAKPTTAPAVDSQRKLAEEILAKLKEGDSFESLAKVYSQAREGEKGGDWGWITRDILQQKLSAVAFNLKPGTHSDLLETPEGYYILFVEDFKAARTKPLDEVRAEIEKQLLQAQRTKVQEAWVKQLRDKAYIRLF